jgi:putative ABC transport system permease protein
VAAALVQIWANKARSVLTTLGIIIAVTSTIVVVSFVQGFGNYVTNMLRGFGTNMVFVVPYNPGGMEGRMLGRVMMDIEDVRAVGMQCDKVRRITPMIFSAVDGRVRAGKRGDVEFQGRRSNSRPSASSSPTRAASTAPSKSITAATSACWAARCLRNSGDESIVGDHVYLNQQRFEVVGILEKKGGFFGESQDKLVLVPFTTSLKMFPFMAWFMPFVIEATAEEHVEEASLQMTRVLRARHGLQPGQPNDFRSGDEFLRDFEKVKWCDQRA